MAFINGVEGVLYGRFTRKTSRKLNVFFGKFATVGLRFCKPVHTPHVCIRPSVSKAGFIADDVNAKARLGAFF